MLLETVMTTAKLHDQPDRFLSAALGEEGIGTLVAAIRRLSGATSVPEVMETITPTARRLLGADGITFVLRENDLCHYAEEDAISPLWKGKRFPMDSCISGWCMKERRSTAIRNVYEDDRIPHDAYRPTFVRSLAMVPVRSDDPLAAMGAYWAEERDVTVEELDLLQTLADSAALAISNADLRHTRDDAELVRQESSHRIKNIFTIALSLARQTEADTPEAYRETLYGRLAALERAHSVIFEASDQQISVREVLKRVLSAYGQNDAERLHLEATDFLCSPSEATDLVLIVHELAANAMRHGAWSSPTGCVTVKCRHAGRRMLLTWQETGGPPARQPSKGGVGMKVIEGIAAFKFGGEVKKEFARRGFSCELLLSLDKG